jgi:hypothetical protein
MHKAATFVFALIVTLSSASQAPESSAPQSETQTAAPALTDHPTSANWPTAQFASVKDESVQKAKRVLDDMIKALGGEAYLNATDMKVEGRSYGFDHGNPVGGGTPFWQFWQWPDKERTEFTKQRDIVELIIGNKGYEITYKGTATMEAKQFDDYIRRRDHSLPIVIRQWLPAKDTLILYSGTAIVEQTLADKVTVFNGSNDSVTIAVDPRSHLPLKKTYSWRSPIDRQMDEESEIFANYRPVQGIQTPYSTMRSRNGETNGQRFLTAITYNNNLPATLFETKGITYNPSKQSQQK